MISAFAHMGELQLELANATFSMSLASYNRRSLRKGTVESICDTAPFGPKSDIGSLYSPSSFWNARYSKPFTDSEKGSITSKHDDSAIAKLFLNLRYLDEFISPGICQTGPLKRHAPF